MVYSCACVYHRGYIILTCPGLLVGLGGYIWSYIAVLLFFRGICPIDIHRMACPEGYIILFGTAGLILRDILCQCVQYNCAYLMIYTVICLHKMLFVVGRYILILRALFVL